LLHALIVTGLSKRAEGIMRQAFIRVTALIVSLMLAALAGPAARAFTLDNGGGGNSDGGPRFVDPDEQVENFGRPDVSRSEPGFHFGVQRPDQSRDWTNPMMRPFAPGSYGTGGND
jgi:hypothetical protein